MAESREIKQTPPSTPEELASKVSEKVNQQLLDEAYSLLKSGVEADFADKNATEKDASWKVISENLAKDGSLSKLSAAFMKDWVTIADGNKDEKLQRNELEPTAQNARNPFYKGMAQEALKQFDTAASLHHDDKAIDKFEMSSFVKRQFMPSQSDFIKSLMKDVEFKVGESPTKAYAILYDSLSMRGSMETPTERIDTLGKVAGELTARGLTPKLSMAFLKKHEDIIDANHNMKVFRDEIARFESSKSPLMSEFAKYIVKEFGNIASIDYDWTQIDSKEMAIYEKKMMQAKE